MPEQPISSLAVYSPRPTVQVDAQSYAKITELLLSLEMTEREGGLSALEMKVRNVASQGNGGAGLAFEDDRVLKLGARIAIYTGDELAPREIFHGVITALEAEYPVDGPPTLVALAEDMFQAARMTRRTKVHENVKIKALVEELAQRLGLEPIVTGLNDDLGVQVQLNESDLAFVRRLLARCDADMQVVGTELHATPRSAVDRGSLELELHGQLLHARVLADLAHQVTKVTVSGWDAAQGQAVTGTSSGANLGVGRGRTGADLLGDLGPRSHHVGHLAVATDQEANEVAAAAFDQRARRFVTVEGTAEGNPSLRVGTNVTLRGLGGRFDNTYYIVLARHRYDRSRGYETDFTAECAYLGAGN